MDNWGYFILLFIGVISPYIITVDWAHLLDPSYTILVIQSDPFGMVKWPFSMVK